MNASVTRNNGARLGGALLSIALLSACSSTDAVRVEEDFGKSVHQMIEAQIHDPQAARTPPAEAPGEFDGVKAGAILETYRTSNAKPQKVQEGMSIIIGK